MEEIIGAWEQKWLLEDLHSVSKSKIPEMSFIAVYFFINNTLYTLQITPTEKMFFFTAGEELYRVLVPTTATILQVFSLLCYHIKKCDYTSLVNTSLIEVNPGAKFSLQLINHFSNILILGQLCHMWLQPTCLPPDIDQLLWNACNLDYWQLGQLLFPMQNSVTSAEVHE